MPTLFSLPRSARVALACAAALCLGAPNAAAAPDKKVSNASDADSYWTISFLGGVVIPQRNTADTHKQGLSAGGRLGWTSKMGLGVYVAGDYSPLPRVDSDDPLESFDTHFGLLTLQPTYTLRWKALRVWLGGGAGVAAERTRQNYRDMPGERRTDYSLAVAGASGLELHLFSGGGLSVTGTYSKLFDKVGFVRDRTYKLVNVTGGLVFAFK